MTKIVYNACYGGFGLSRKAMERYAELTGGTVTAKKAYSFTYYKVVYPDGKELSDDDIKRTDPALVKTVEELGEAASDEHASLAIEEVPAGTQYRIDEYDGNERVVTIDGYDWETA